MPDLLDPLARALIAVVAVIALCRINGLRSFSKMSSFDFALTVATGSVLASTIQNGTLETGLVALAAIFAIQFAIARLRQSSARIRWLTDNEPLLLVENGCILHRHLKAARVTEDDLFAKLRSANVLTLPDVRAVVLETTGDISVIHASGAARPLDRKMLSGVRRRL